jgi:DNA-binding NarL/FixJ family response regulator
MRVSEPGQVGPHEHVLEQVGHAGPVALVPGAGQHPDRHRGHLGARAVPGQHRYAGPQRGTVRLDCTGQGWAAGAGRSILGGKFGHRRPAPGGPIRPFCAAREPTWTDSGYRGAVTTSASERVRVALVNDYEIIVRGLAHLLEAHADRIQIVDMVAGELPHRAADVALFDAYGRRGLGVEAIAQMVADPIVRHVAVFSAVVVPHLVDKALAAGASGYLPKSLSGDELTDALVRIANGERVVLGDGARRAGRASQPPWPGMSRGLTERESELLTLVARGLRNEEIAEALYVSTNTVKSHLKSAFRKLGARNRAEAAAAVAADATFGHRNGADVAG